MRFTKPAWVLHKDSTTSGTKTDASSSSNPKRLSIFSIHVHPDGSRIATGGLDGKIRIWSTKPILSAEAEEAGRPPKSLSTLMMHTGPVLTVRWAGSGRWLASGSDDQTVMVWDHDPSARGRVWGTDDYNVEGWKPLKRLAGHSSDVTDVAWAPQDRYLASVSLDSLVIIWCGYSLEILRKLDLHNGFVKGVCWDPVGEYLATQSDDRTVKIWRTSDWQLEAEVTKPFEDSPGSTFFRRLSWSPDGAHITASNATNNKGYVFIAAVITRNSWTSDISLVGHENTVEVACYNPHIFLRNPAQPVQTSNICSVVALGADDRSVSVWQTKSARPLIVAKEVFDRQIMDLCWSWDGLTLYAASSDGFIAVFAFEASELEGIATHEDQKTYLAKFGFVPPPLPEGYSHLGSAQQQQAAAAAASTAMASTSDFGGPKATNGQEKVNILVAKKAKDKKRVTLAGSATSVPTATAAAAPTGSGAVASTTTTTTTGPKRVALTTHHPNGTTTTSSAPSSAAARSKASSTGGGFPLPSEQPFDQPDSWSRHADAVVPMDVDVDTAMMDTDVHIDSLMEGSSASAVVTTTTTTTATGSGRSGPKSVAELPKVKARTLGGDRPFEKHVSQPISEWRGRRAEDVVGGSSGVGLDALLTHRLPVPPLVTYLSVEISESSDVVEVKNMEKEGVTEVAVLSGKQTQWLDYLASPAVCVKATGVFCAVGMRDGGVVVYTRQGRRMMPALCLGAPCAFMEVNKTSLAVVTTTGMLYSWNVKKATANFPPVSILPLLASAPNPNTTLNSLSVRENGTPHLLMGTAVFAYDPSLLTFVKLSDKWWSGGSDVWQARTARSGAAGSAFRGVVAGIEAAVNLASSSGSGGASSSSTLATNAEGDTTTSSSSTDMAVDASGPFPNGNKPSWWSPAITLGHLETRMHAAKVLESGSEYKQALLLYAKRLGDEGFRGKAEELVKELFGPVYWRPGASSGGGGAEQWNPSVAGLAKRDLVKDVLGVFARSKSLARLAAEWQDILKKSALVDDF